MAMLLYRSVIFHTFFFFGGGLFSPTSTFGHIPDEPENLRILQARRVFQAIDEDHSGFISLEDMGHRGMAGVQRPLGTLSWVRFDGAQKYTSVN